MAALFLLAFVAFADTYPRQLSVDALHYIRVLPRSRLGA